MPWPPEGMSSTWASLHWLPTSAFTLPWHVSDVCIQGPRLPICLLLILTCLDTLGRRPSGRPAGTLSNNNQNGINQTNRKPPLRTANSCTTLSKNICSSVVGKTNLSHDKTTEQINLTVHSLRIIMGRRPKKIRGKHTCSENYYACFVLTNSCILKSPYNILRLTHYPLQILTCLTYKL